MREVCGMHAGMLDTTRLVLGGQLAGGGAAGNKRGRTVSKKRQGSILGVYDDTPLNNQ